MKDHLKLVSATANPSKVTFEMTVPQEYCNRTGMMHGGAVAMILDMCTSAAQGPTARKGFWEFGGVSRTLSLTYLRPMPQNMDLVIECEVLQTGKNLGTTYLLDIRSN